MQFNLVTSNFLAATLKPVAQRQLSCWSFWIQVLIQLTRNDLQLHHPVFRPVASNCRLFLVKDKPGFRGPLPVNMNFLIIEAELYWGGLTILVLQVAQVVLIIQDDKFAILFKLKRLLLPILFHGCLQTNLYWYLFLNNNPFFPEY